eukprot:3366424-Lingulodinium_polyedra.AAC.1
MLQSEELQASVADLHTCLTNEEAEGVTHTGTEVARGSSGRQAPSAQSARPTRGTAATAPRPLVR